jgi:methionyl-tRNA synthetase
MLRLAFVLCAFLVCAACSEPPQKEIDRAQGAIDAARAAGAEQYASEPFTAATSALQQAHEAVEQRDYRQALSHALEASERAQEAARNAADGKAAARSRVDTALKATATLLQQLETRIKSAESARIPAKDLRPVTAGAASAATAVQEARATLEAGKYLEASEALTRAHGDIEAQIRALDEMLQARATRRPRPRGPRG